MRLLLAKGYTILARNWRVRSGELDIVAVTAGLSSLSKSRRAAVRDSIGRATIFLSGQMRRNFRAALFYCRVIGKPLLPGRFDLIEVIASPRMIRSIVHRCNYLPPLEPGGKRGRA